MLPPQQESNNMSSIWFRVMLLFDIQVSSWMLMCANMVDCSDRLFEVANSTTGDCCLHCFRLKSVLPIVDRNIFLYQFLHRNLQAPITISGLETLAYT